MLLPLPESLAHYQAGLAAIETSRYPAGVSGSGSLGWTKKLGMAFRCPSHRRVVWCRTEGEG